MDVVVWANDRDILLGKGGSMQDPGGGAARSQIASMLTRLLALK